MASAWFPGDWRNNTPVIVCRALISKTKWRASSQMDDQIRFSQTVVHHSFLDFAFLILD